MTTGDEDQGSTGCALSDLSWSGLVECARDGLTALRTATSYATVPAFREKVDGITDCIRELEQRLIDLGSVPGGGEPAFVLLGRDPQAADLVRRWAENRLHSGDNSHSNLSKVSEALEVSERMDQWQKRRPMDILEPHRAVPESQSDPS